MCCESDLKIQVIAGFNIFRKSPSYAIQYLFFIIWQFQVQFKPVERFHKCHEYKFIFHEVPCLHFAVCSFSVHFKRLGRSLNCQILYQTQCVVLFIFCLLKYSGINVVVIRFYNLILKLWWIIPVTDAVPSLCLHTITNYTLRFITIMSYQCRIFLHIKSYSVMMICRYIAPQYQKYFVRPWLHNGNFSWAT